MEQSPAARFVDVLGRLGYKTQQQIADLLQIARPTAGTIVRKEREPSFADVARLKAAHDEVNIDWIFTGKGSALGYSLTPTEQRPQPDPPAPRPIELSQEEHRRELVASAENVLLRQIIAGKDELISELRGKPSDNSDAAGPTDPTAPTPDPRVAAGFRMAWMARRREQKRAAGLS